MKTLFEQYIDLKEEAKKTVTSKVKLQKTDGSNEFAPFSIDRSNHPNLRLLVKAFVDSSNVGTGYTTVEKGKGEVEPKLKKKTLYLTGGAVRDHLKGKTPRNYDLVTDATPSEIRMILTHAEAGFTEVKPKSENNKNYDKLPPGGSKNKVFYVSRWDKQGKEIEFIVEINKEKFELASLSKTHKSRNLVPDNHELTDNIEDDASNRDFTINSMYIPLTQPDGDNSDLIDPHGGAHHLKNGEVNAIGTMSKQLKDDPLTGHRYLRIVSRYGNPDKIPANYHHAISQINSDIPKEHARKEFVMGLEHPDSNPRKYITAYKKTGLLKTLFPEADFDEKDMPENFQGDRWLASAWILRDSDPDKIKEELASSSWSKQEANDIAYLVKLYQWGSKSKFNPDMFYDIKKCHTGLTKAKIKEWMQMVKTQGPELDGFLKHDDKDLTPMVYNSEGKRTVNPEFTKHLGRHPQGFEFEDVKRQLSTNRFLDLLKKI